MIHNNVIVKKYSSNSNLLFDNTDGDNTMKALKDDTTQDVFYTMVNCVDDEGEKTVSQVYTLYRGMVLSEDGKVLENNFVGETNSTTPEATSSSLSVTSEINLGASNSESENTNSPISKSTLKGMIAWMSTYNPMSSSGGKISYTSESKSTSVGEIVPLYPLDKIVISNNSSFGDYVISAKGSDQYIGQYY